MSPRVKKAGAALLAATTLFLPFYPILAAQMIPDFTIDKPFGGRITKIQACQSPPGLILHIGPPFSMPGFENLWLWGGQYFLSPISIIHSYGVIAPEVLVLGRAEPNTKTCVGAIGGGGGFVLNGLAETGLIEGAEFLKIPTFINLPIFGPISLISIGVNMLSALGISFFKKNPPTYGPAYPIIRIGTGPRPAPDLPKPPILTPI